MRNYLFLWAQCRKQVVPGGGVYCAAGRQRRQLLELLHRIFCGSVVNAAALYRRNGRKRTADRLQNALYHKDGAALVARGIGSDAGGEQPEMQYGWTHFLSICLCNGVPGGGVGLAGGRQLVLLLEQPDSVCRIFAVYPVRNEMRQLALVRNAVEICLQFQDMLPGPLLIGKVMG